MKKIEHTLKNNLDGLYFGNRIILPFHAHFLKVVLENEIITDFSNSSEGVQVVEDDDFTSLYFLEIKSLKEKLSKFSSIKMVVCEKDKNIFDFSNHTKLVCYVKEKHKLVIEQLDQDITFIE